MTALNDTAMGLEMRSYFDGRRLCLAATPPCAIRPCVEHIEAAGEALGASRCEDCADGIDSEGEPCERCDGWSRVWTAPASMGVTGPATGAPLDGAAGPGVTSAVRPGPAAP